MLRVGQLDILDGAGDEYSRYGIGYRVGYGMQDDGRYKAREIIWASGAASAYRRQMLEEVSLFDERFEAYYEDVDLGLRALAAGWSGEYVPEAVVEHHGGWSDRNDRSIRLTTRNSLLVIAKCWPTRLIASNLPFLVYGQLRNAAWAVRNGHGRAWAAGFFAAARSWRSFRRASPASAPWEDKLARTHPFGEHRRQPL
jgi:GT2 family glycosyltransferase